MLHTYNLKNGREEARREGEGETDRDLELALWHAGRKHRGRRLGFAEFQRLCEQVAPAEAGKRIQLLFINRYSYSKQYCALKNFC